MADQQNNQGSKRNAPKRAPLPKPKLPGSNQSGMPGLGGTRARPGPAKPPTRKAQPPANKRPSGPAQAPNRPTGNTRQGAAPGQKARRPSTGSGQAVRPEPAPKPKARKEPATIEELIPVLIRHAVKRDDGLNISLFDEKFMPRLKRLVPEALKRMESEVINEYLVDIAHALYVAIVVGQFNNRPVLAGVRAAELAADLVERVLNSIQGREDKRMTVIRCANLLVGLTLNSVRLLESTSLGSQSISGFTDKYERSVITTYGLKTQAEASGQAPWVGQSSSPLDKRIGRAINTMSNVFGDYIGEHGETMGDAEYDEVLGEFDGFMERFSPYIEGGRTSAEERRKKLARDGGGTSTPGTKKVEPLDIDELRTRPAGVEIVLADGRVLFASTDDARRIGEAADAEVDDTARRHRAEIEKRQQEQDDVALAEIQEQMKSARDRDS